MPISCQKMRKSGSRGYSSPFYRNPSSPHAVPQNLEHNVPGGKLNRGISVVDTVEILRGEQLSEKQYFEVALLGWGIELVSKSDVPMTSVSLTVCAQLQAFFLVSDDMMDSSITRRGQPCWYRVEEPLKVGLVAINDSFMLEAAIYYLLKRHFK